MHAIFCSHVHSISCFVVKQLWLVDRNYITNTAGTLTHMRNMPCRSPSRVCQPLMNHYLFILDINRILLCHFKVLFPRVCPSFNWIYCCFCLWNFLNFSTFWFEMPTDFKAVKVNERKSFNPTFSGRADFGFDMLITCKDSSWSRLLHIPKNSCIWRSFYNLIL